MSTLEYNTLVSAGGDGLKRSVEKPPPKRTPVPSSRKLTTRPQIRNDNVKVKLENALNDLSTPKTRQFTRKRSQTVAEITPSKRKLQEESNDRLNRSLRVESSVGRSVPRKEDATRCVYQQLLLNAWRRRRIQVATLTDSSKQLQTQVDQLQIQVDVLQKLRESESQRRLKSASESEKLRHEKEELSNTIEKLIKDRESMERTIVSLQRKMEEINVSYVNLKNELLTAKTDLAAYERKLQKECRNNEMLESEKQYLLEKIEEYKNTSTEHLQTINRLQNDLELVERTLDSVNLDNSNLENSKSELEMNLEKEKDIRDDLEHQFIKSRIREDKLQKRVHELKKSVCLLNEAKKQMLLDNFALKKTLEELEAIIREERSKRWWKNAAKMMLNTLHSAAYIMLPAYPKKMETYSPTETVEDNTMV